MQKLEQPHRWDETQLLALLDAADQLNSTLSLDEVLRHILTIGGDLTASEAGSVILHDTEHNDLYFAAATGPSANTLPDIRIPVGKGKAGMVFATGESLVENLLEDHYRAIDQQTHFVTHSMICVPLRFGSKTYGVLQLINKRQGKFEGLDLELATRLANQATIALRNAMLFERMISSSGLYGHPDVRRDLIPIVLREENSACVETASIMFADMRGFTRFCRLLGGNPSAIQNHLNDFFRLLAGSVMIHRGIVNKFLGDGIMAIFRGPDAALRALQCAFDIRSRFHELRADWEHGVSEDIEFLDVGVGIASGEVIIGAVGDDKVSDFTILGTAVNLASALEREARDGRFILCENRTFRATQAWISKCGGPTSFIDKSGGGIGVAYKIYDVQAIRSNVQRGSVFICHAHSDIERIRETIIPSLDKAGFDVFTSENSIQIGAKWDKAIGLAIENSQYFLIAISHNAINSIHVGEEIHYAFSHESARSDDWIIPVLLDVVEPSQIYWQLGRRQYSDVTNSMGIADFERNLQELSAKKKQLSEPSFTTPTEQVSTR